MMASSFSEMTDFEINKAVAIAEGHSCYYGDGSFTNGLMGRKVTVKGNGVVGCMDFCNSWADAGPIIAANKISLDFDADGYEPPQNAWCKASSPCSQVYYGGESEPLRAAMIVFLMMQERPDVA